MRLLIDRVDWGKTFKILFAIVSIIVIIIIWIPEKREKIASYTKLKEEQVDTLVTQKYINEVIDYIDNKDTNALFNKVSKDYLLYNRLDKGSFTKEIEKEFKYSNVQVANVEKVKYADNVIYRITLRRDRELRNINIIEEQPNHWSYTFDDLYSYRITNYSNTYQKVKFTIDSIYQTFDYVEMTCYIQNQSENSIDLHLEQYNSVLLILSNNNVVEMSNSQVDDRFSKLDVGEVSSRTLKFNVDIVNQQYIEKIIFNNIEINGEKYNLIIQIDI